MPVRIKSKKPAVTPPGGSPPPTPPATIAQTISLPRPPSDVPQLPAGLSLCMIVKNEERFLAKCLQSIAPYVDEICIVDTGSTDRTVEIAKEFGAKVELREWRNDFSWARNEAIAMASYRWIFMLDADEEFLPGSESLLAQLKEVPAFDTGVWVRCYNESNDYQGTGQMSHLLIRIFPNHPRIRFRGLIHEFITLDQSQLGLKASASPIAIKHSGYLKEIVTERDKGARNLAIVKAAVEREPEEAFHWFNLGTTAFLIGDYETARSALEKMIEVNQDQPRGFFANGLSALADVYTEKMNDPVKGEEAAQLCLKFSPHYANGHFALGKALVAQKRLGDAREAFQAAIGDGEYNHLQFVVDDEVSKWKAFSEIGATYVAEGNDEAAVEWFEKGLKNRPSALPLRLNLARAYERLKRIDEAARTFAAAFRDLPSDQSAVDYVNFLLRAHRDREALDAIRAAMPLISPTAQFPVLMAGAAVCERNGWPEREQFLRDAAERMPGAALALDPLEAAFRARGDLAAVDRLYAAEDATEPLEIADFRRRANRLLAQGRFSESRAMAERGLELAPADAALVLGAALACSGMGDGESARQWAQSVPPDSGEYFLRAQMMLALDARNRGAFDEAIAATEAVLSQTPQNIEAVVLRSNLLQQVGRDSESEQMLLSALRFDPQRIAVELSMLYLRQERFEDARRIADAALVR